MNNQTDDIKHNYELIKIRVHNAAVKCGRKPEEISIVAVTKTQTADIIKSGIDAGIRVFGENYAQELKEKHDLLGEDAKLVQWHFIGHLQTNKVKFISSFVSLIHSVDSLHLAQEISRQAQKYNRTIEILLQVNTSGEESKSGCEPEDIYSLAKDAIKIPNLKVTGLMTIGTFTDDIVQIKKEFRMLRSIRDELNNKYGLTQFKHLSVGMTGDFEIAIEEGSTFIRVGTAIFGQRIYNNF